MAEKKKGGNVVNAVWEIAEPIAKELGLILWDVKFQKEGANWYLRIIIDKVGGVGIDDCVAMNDALDAPLDEADPIDQSYNLQISSPGIERDLKNPMHYMACIGWDVEVKLFAALDGRKTVKGILADYDEENGIFTIDENGTALTLEKGLVSKIKTVYDFED